MKARLLLVLLTNKVVGNNKIRVAGNNKIRVAGNNLNKLIGNHRDMVMAGEKGETNNRAQLLSHLNHSCGVQLHI